MRINRSVRKCWIDHRRSAVVRGEGGFSLLETALVLPLLLLLLVGAVDFGKGYYLAIEVGTAAESGALYGSQNWTDVSGMQSAALLDAGDVPGMTASGSYGCQCSDGSSAVANCTSAPICGVNVVNYVQVNTTATYKPVLPYPGIPSVIVLKGTSRLRAGH